MPTGNFKIIDRWSDGNVRWFRLAWAGGQTTVHCVTVGQ